MAGHPSRRAGSPGLRLSICLVSAFILAGCSSMLPEKQQVMDSPWKTFQEAKSTYDKIVPNESVSADLDELGIDPYSTPNVRILSYLDLIGRFLPNNSVRQEDLDKDVRACIAALSECTGYEFSPSQKHSKRVGWVLADVFNFSRTTLKTGWSFSALIVLNKDKVIYKVWNGIPVKREKLTAETPLGPFHNSGDFLKSAITVPKF